jgi:hypothetical protein
MLESPSIHNGYRPDRCGSRVLPFHRQHTDLEPIRFRDRVQVRHVLEVVEFAFDHDLMRGPEFFEFKHGFHGSVPGGRVDAGDFHALIEQPVRDLAGRAAMVAQVALFGVVA